ncbi:MAG: tetratricopeptide repeat protein [Magnetococcus sp. DMHC-1]|nr:tetratricopeptide repeat protein [Magnetococcales bacterium]
MMRLPLMIIWLVLAPSWALAAATNATMAATDSFRLAWDLMDRAADFERRDAWDQAVSLLQKAQGHLEKTVGPQHTLFLAVILRLGRIDLYRKQYPAAREKFLLAKNLAEKQFKPDSLIMAEILQNLAEASPPGNLTEASPPGNPAKSSPPRNQVETSPATRTVPNQTVSNHLSDTPLPAELRKQAATIHISRFDAPLPGKGEGLLWAGDEAREAGQNDEAFRNYAQALQIFMKNPGPFHAKRVELLLKLAELNRARNMLEPAAELLKSALAITENMWGTDHPAVVPILESLARNHLDQNKVRLGQPVVARLLTITRTTWGIEHPRTMRASIMMADYLLAGFEEDQALQILRGLRALLETSTVPHTVELAMVVERLAEIDRLRSIPPLPAPRPIQ